MTGCLRWSCRLTMWMVLVFGIARWATAELPSGMVTPLPSADAGEAKEPATADPNGQWLTMSRDGDCTCLDSVCCECPCPQWAVTAGAVIFSRSNPDGDQLYEDSTIPLSGSDFDMGWASGFEIQLARRNINCGDDLSLRYFFVDGWSGDAYAQFPGNSQVDSQPAIAFVGPREVHARLTSELNSFELDYSCQSAWLPAVKWLVGFRTLELDENLNTGLVYPGGGFPTVYHTVGVQNRLYGVQIGSQMKLLNMSRLSLEGFLLTGLYGNSAAQRSAIWDDVSDPDYVVDRHSVVSFVGETGITGRIRLTDCLAVRADYRVLWVTGVADATEQVPVSNFDTGMGIDTDSSAFYHGVFVGLDWAY